VFLPQPAREVRCNELSPQEQALKREMLDAFASQREVLRPFGIDRERFAIAPRSDFLQAPHPGTLHYERYDWGITGLEWRRQASTALQQLSRDTEWVSRS
jgi:hypothetical protein